MTYGDKMVMVDNVDRSTECRIPQELNVQENSPGASPFHIDVD